MKGESYSKVLSKLYVVNKYKSKRINLDRLLKAADLLGNPQSKVNYIHVAGTNGKGSVSKKLSEVLRLSGMKTGLFISPHISSFRERISINQSLIEESYVVEEMSRIFRLCDKERLELSYFEYITLLAFNYFHYSKIDIGVLEAGLGGRLDSTNIIKCPLLSVVTSIGFDHMDSLGTSLQDIALQKAGIIKPNAPVVIGSDCHPLETFTLEARKNGSKLTTLHFSSHDFDEDNSQLAKLCVDVLKETYKEAMASITDEAIKEGVKIKQPCRNESVFDSLGKETVLNRFTKLLPQAQVDRVSNGLKGIYLDVSHNLNAFEKLLGFYRLTFPLCKLRLVCGFGKSKDIEKIASCIFKYADSVSLVSSDHIRLHPFPELKRMFSKISSNYLSPVVQNKSQTGDVKETLRKLIEDCAEEEQETVILVCGSFFIMSEVRTVLGYKEEKDTYDLNEATSSLLPALDKIKA